MGTDPHRAQSDDEGGSDRGLPPALEPACITDVLIAALAGAEQELADEHAPLGLDALDETALHPILAQGFERAGWGVFRETLYPGDSGSSDDDDRGGEPSCTDREERIQRGTDRSEKDTARDRCDLVLTESPGVALLDPVHSDRRLRAAADTLFADLAPAMEADANADAVRPEDAFWLEIKSVAQHAYRDGVPGPNRSYAAEMVNGPAADVCKLIGDGIIERAALALILFTESEDIARNDIDQTAHALLDMGLPVGIPDIASTPIADRAGNAAATVAVFTARGLGLPLAFDE